MLEQSDLDLAYRLVDSAATLSDAITKLANGNGLFAVDAERASGFRYGNDAYLIQITRRDAGTFLIDPVSVDDLRPLTELMNPQTWIFHAAGQDLPCLKDLGLFPTKIVDTELGARLLGLPKVGLGTLTEHYLNIHLEKAHSADDWSVRPLPEDWLEYAAFDAAVLPSLWEHVAADLEEAGKLELAEQEFDYVLHRPPKDKPTEPWRKLSGIHQLRGARSLAIARELWLARDEVARARDIAPGRLIPDRSISFAAKYVPRSAGDLASQKEFRGRASRTELDRWWRAIRRGKITEDLPTPAPRDPHSIPHQRTWEKKRPEAAARLAMVKPAIADAAKQLDLPIENLLTPDTLRRVAWEPIFPVSPENVGKQLHGLGARDWQIQYTQQVIADAFVASL
ncbi:MAG: HRDC domain-containing protein [Canibacter sp.]